MPTITGVHIVTLFEHRALFAEIEMIFRALSRLAVLRGFQTLLFLQLSHGHGMRQTAALTCSRFSALAGVLLFG